MIFVLILLERQKTSWINFFKRRNFICICIGKQIDEIPSKKPSILEVWDSMLLIAIPEKENAKNVSWFYLSSLASMTKWLNEIICTLPKRHRQLFESSEDDYGNIL